MTSRYHSGKLETDMDEDRVEKSQHFSRRSANAQQEKIVRTTLMRAEEQAETSDPESLPIGQVIQVFSVYSEVRLGDVKYLSIVRKTLSKVSDTAVVVGDRVRLRLVPLSELTTDPAKKLLAHTIPGGQPEAMIEQILPRKTILTRADSFKQVVQHPIVANADQMFIVVSLAEPPPRWGLIDRMIVAAQSGNLQPIVCLNKMDLATTPAGKRYLAEAEDVLAYYTNLLIPVIRTSIGSDDPIAGATGLDEARSVLSGRVTILAGHSGVGKSSLVNAIQPTLHLRTGAISGYTGKGRHTTTSARYYPLEFGPPGGAVIDTPGVKLFGLWGVTADNLIDYFPDVAKDVAPAWRKESFERIKDSLTR